MNLRTAALTLVTMLAAGLLTFQVFQRQFTGGLMALAFDPSVDAALRHAMEDQRRLADLDPDNAPVYRDHYERVKEISLRRTVLEHNRQEISTRFERLLLAVLMGILSVMAGLHLWSRHHRERRLARMGAHLADLASGETEISIADQRRDMLGRIARMIEDTSGVLLAQKQRLAVLENLSVWQEAARRHAHEIRTPLTAARMELSQLVDGAVEEAPEHASDFRDRQASINEELDRLADFTKRFASFAKIPDPVLEPVALGALVTEYARFFGEGWDNLTLQVSQGAPGPMVALDREQIRQVLYKLCQNASRAMGGRQGCIAFTIEARPAHVAVIVSDDGPGIPPEIRAHLFTPYVTTSPIGEGMGLGLAIAKKIMLDHGGDLLLGQTGATGTSFQLRFPKEPV